MEAKEHPLWPRLAASEHELIDLLVADPALEHSLPPVTGCALVVAIQSLELERVLVVTSTRGQVDSWGSYWTWKATPQGKAKSYGHGLGSGPDYGSASNHGVQIVAQHDLEPFRSEWEEKRFDLVLLDCVFCPWAEQLSERVWRVILEAAGKTYSTLGEFALTGVLPFKQAAPLGVRFRASGLSERLSA
jgi:hypothetical protein